MKAKEVIMTILTALLFVAVVWLFLNAWAEEKPVTLYDHTSGFEQQYADTNWCTEK